MIPIYICEDNKETLEYITKQIQKTIIIESLDMDIRLASDNPDSLLDAVCSNKDRGVYFLDIDLSHTLSGFDVATKIREKDSRGFIVFVTTHGEMALDTFKYQIEAMDYILKDEPDKIADRIRTSLLNINQRMQEDRTKESDYFSVRYMDEVRYFKLEDIILFETSHEKHKVILITDKAHIEFFSSLKEIEEKIGKPFVRCHRSYLVNTNYIKAINTKESYLLLESGKKCELSRQGKKKIEEIK